MATTTIEGSTVVFSNSGAAADLAATGSEDGSLSFCFDVLAASGGGTKTTIYSVDDGISGDDNPTVVVKSAFSAYDTDLLYKDGTVDSWQLGGDTSLAGAHVWIGNDKLIHYDASGLSAKLQALAVGETFTDTFEYTIKMSNGTLSVGHISVTITGTNDNPVAVADVNAVKEDTATNPVSGNVLANDTDVDTLDTHTVSAVNGAAGNVGIDFAGTYGTLHLNSDGGYTYTLDNSKASVQALAEGQQVTDSFAYTDADNHGGTSSSTLTVTITGTNDNPVAVADVNAVKEDTATNPVSGNVLANDTDVDTLDTHTVSAVNGAAGNVGIDFAGTYGTLHLNSDGGYTYTLDNSKASVQALAEGQQVTDSFAYTDADNHGGTSSSTLTVTITGTNDNPVAVADVNAVKEDTATNPVSGNVLANDTDVDTLDTHTVSAVNGAAGNVGIDFAGIYGTLHLNSDGGYTYTLDNSKASVQALAEGQQVTDSFAYTDADNHGGTSSSTLTVTITGTNDNPVAVADVNAVKEDTATNPVSGNVLANDTDVDTLDTHTVSAVNGAAGNVGIDFAGTYGTLHLNSDGGYTYTLDNSKASVQALAEGQQVTDSFAYTDADNHGGTSSSTLTVTITGTNDNPVAVADVNAVKEDTATNPVSGNVLANDTDVDTLDTHTVSAVNGAAGNVGIDFAGIYGTLHLNSDGGYTYTLDNSKASVQALAEGQQVTDSFAYTDADNHGGTSSSTLTVTITGTNDNPVAVADVNAVKEDTATNPVSGNVLANDTDVDTLDTHTVSAVNGAAGNVGIDFAGIYGTLHLNSDGGYTYTLDNSKASVQALAEGQQVTDSFAYTDADNHGGTSSSTLTVTITGTNDNPVAVADVNAVKEDTATNPVSGNVLANDTDVDTLDTHTVSAVNGAAGNVGIDFAGIYGTLHFNSDGGYTYTLDNSKASVQALAEGQQVTDSFAYTDADNHGGTSSSTLTVTITGTNDNPVAVADVNAVKEDTATNPVSGNVLANDTDVDTLDTHTVSAVNGAAGNVGIDFAGIYGTLHLNSDGGYTYTLDNSKASVQALAEGQQVTDSFAYTDADNHGGTSSSTLTVTITGTNDNPVAVADVNAVKEDTATNPVSGNVLANDTDVDTLDTHTVSAVNGAAGNVGIDFAGIYGTLHLNSDGGYTYTLDNSKASVQALAEGQQVTDSFAYTDADNHGGTSSSTLTVTITGTNDAAVIGDQDTGSVTEAGAGNPGTPTASGLLTVSDPDTGQSAFNTQTNVTTSYGHFTLTSGGSWNYTLDNSNTTVNALNTGQPLHDLINVSSVDGTSHTVDITIHGTTDDLGPPTGIAFNFAVANLANLEGGNSLNANQLMGSFIATGDPDSGDTFTYALGGTDAGKFSLTSAGALSTGNADVAGSDPGTTYSLTVTITDQGGNQFVANPVKIVVGDNHANVISLGPDAANIALGLNGADAVTGTAGFDAISGGANADNITGGGGGDFLVGGDNKDTFIYTAITDSRPGMVGNNAPNYDTIVGFTSGNTDTIDTTSIAALTTVQGALATATSAVHAHDIAWFFNGTDTIVYANATGADVNAGSLSMSMEIHLLGNIALQSSDFHHA